MNFLRGITFLITGAANRLGVKISSRLEELGAEIIPLDTDTSGTILPLKCWKAKTKPIRIINTTELDKLKVPDYVINFHWQFREFLTFSEQFNYELINNIYSLGYLWHWLRLKHVKRFINISSIQVYNGKYDGVINSCTKPVPDTPFGLANFTVENFFDYYFKCSIFNVIHTRLGPVTSIDENPLQIMSRLYRSAFEGEMIILNKSHITYPMHIDEIVDLIISSAIYADKSRYNLVGMGYFDECIASMFEKVSGKNLNIRYTQNLSGNNYQIINSDTEKLQQRWIRTFSLEQIINKVIALNNANQFQFRIN